MDGDFKKIVYNVYCHTDYGSKPQGRRSAVSLEMPHLVRHCVHNKLA